LIPISDFPKDSRRKLEAIVSKVIALGHNPGVSIALVKEGKMVYAEGFGARDVAKSLPARAMEAPQEKEVGIKPLSGGRLPQGDDDPPVRLLKPDEIPLMQVQDEVQLDDTDH